MKRLGRGVQGGERAQGVIEYILLLGGIVFVSLISLMVYSSIVENAGTELQSSASQTTSAMEQAISEALGTSSSAGENEPERVVEIPGNSVDEDGDGLILCNPNRWWWTHGRYVSCVARETAALVDAGDMTDEERAELISEAAHSDVGKHWWIWIYNGFRTTVRFSYYSIF